jgi:DNA repair exonuclease SbcCD ATPase subunit
MKINYLKIQNFKNISDIEINNFRDINIVTGNNGEGKSSTLQAIIYLLTDSLSDKIEEFVKWGEDSFLLHTLFNHAGQEYDYEIIGSKKGTKRTLYVNGKDNVYLNSDATKKLAEIINPLLTLYSAISEQRNVDRLLFEKQADQLEKLKKLFGIEKLKDIVEDIKSDIKLNDTKLIELETEVKVLENRKYHFIDEPDESEIEKIKQDNKNLVLLELPEYDDSKLSELQKECNDLEKKEIVLRNSIKQYEQNFNILGTLEAKKLIKNKENEKLVIKRLPRGEEITEESLKKLQDDLNRINVDLLQYNKKYSLCLSGKCPECEQEYHADITQIEKNIIQLKSDKAETTLVLEAETQRRKEIEQIKKDNEKIQFQKNRIEKEIQEIDKEIENISKTIAKPEGNCNELDEQLMNINIEIEHQKRLKIIYDQTIKRNETALKLKQENENKILVIQTQIESAKKQNELIRQEMNSDRSKIQKLQENVDNLKLENRQLDSVKKIIDKEFSAWIISNGIDFIKSEMNKFFTKTYNKGLIVDIIQDKKGIEFLYGENKESLRTINMASGFEKAILAMSFRYALCGMQNLGIMILDEIDSDASDENSIKLFKMLLTNKEIQFFIVTHNLQAVDIMEQEYNAKVFEINKGVLK